jgi:membrane-associated phospholipid phosphatase
MQGGLVGRMVNWLGERRVVELGFLAHVSSAFSAAWALYFIFPKRRWLGHTILVYAISVSLATVYGRYHYAADVLAGFAVSLIALGVGFVVKQQGDRHGPDST